MIPEQYIKVRWNGKNIKYYTEKGYVYTKNNDFFWAHILEVNHTSGVRFTFVCDYCNVQVHDKRISDFYKYRDSSILKKDSCTCCVKIKKAEESLAKHGVSHPMMLPSTVAKQKQTFLERHGVESVNQMPNFREKVKDASLRNYGVEHPTQSPLVINKRRETNLKKYGHINASQSVEVKEKIAITYYEQGNIKTSKQQLAVFETLKELGYDTKINYPVSTLNLDMAVFVGSHKIDVEYDGWYWHQDSEKDRRRDEYLKSQGWSILRIKSGRAIPSASKLNETIINLVQDNKKYSQLILEDWRTKESYSPLNNKL